MRFRHRLLERFFKYYLLALVLFFILGAAYAQPPGNRGLYFDGIDDHVVVSHDPVFDVDTEVTYEAWVKLDNDFDVGTIMRKIQGSGEDKFVQINSDRTIRFYLWAGGPSSFVSVYSISQIPLDQWTHIACTFEENVAAKIYINGVEDASIVPTQNPRNATANWYIGSRTGTASFFEGQIDEIKIFNTARTAAEVLSDMTSTANNIAGMVAYWNFEDDAAAGNQTLAEDVTTNTNDGTLTGAMGLPLWSIRVTNNTNDGLGSLRQAINQSNTDTDKDYIDFSIPGGGVQTITPTSTLPTITESVLIDGYTQPGARANTLAVGNDAILNIQLDGARSVGSALRVSASNSEIFGLIVHGFSGNGVVFTDSGNIIAGCQIGLDALGNVSSNMRGVRTNVSNNTIGLPTPAGRNTISGNQFNGIQVEGGSEITNLIIQNNYLGTSPDGLTLMGGGTIQLINSSSCIIGGTTPLERNVAGSGISMNGSATGGHQILGNYIGVGADGTTAFGIGAGIHFQSDNLSNMQIGGINAGEANIIANNTNGILLTAGTASTGNSIRGNIMYGNTIGIDLGTAGAGTNDVDDADTGNNNLQNFPLINDAEISGGNIAINFSVDATTTNSAYGPTGLKIDFYQSDGNRQGEEYLGTINYPEGSAQSSFTGSVPLGTIVIGDVIVATATDNDGNTSEFSEDFTVNNLPTAANNTLAVNEDKVLTILTENFNYNDPDSHPFTLVNITSIPTEGTLYLDADNDDTFDAGEALVDNDQVLIADLDTGNLQFLGSENENGTPFTSFGFNVNDGLGNSSVDNTITINVIAVNDAPAITAQALALSTQEDTELIIGLDAVTVTDPDNTFPDDFSLAVQAGTNYSFSGNTITPNTNFNGTLSVPVIVNDGADDSPPFNLMVTVNPVNDAPIISAQVNTLSMDEDTELAIQLADVTVNDPDNTFPDDFSFTVQTGTNYSISGNTITSATNFNGTLPVQVIVNDGADDSLPFDLMVTVNPVNDAPSIDTNTRLTLSKGSMGTIGTAQLSSSDFDNSAIELIYTITTDPIRGTLSLSSFTQQDIIDGNVTYVHDDSDNFSDTFSFTVSDGTNTTTSQVFNIEIEFLEEHLEVYLGEDATGISIFNNQVDPIDLGQTLINIEKSETFTLVNSGGVDLTINISLSDPAFGVRGAPSLIHAGASANFMIVLLSSQAGIFNTDVTINSSIQDFTFDVIGEVIDPGQEKLPDLEVFNAVTPNGDGIHDFLKIKNIELYPDNQVQVFTRNGQRVFDIRGYNNNQVVFEGRSNVGNSKILNNGTYYYLIDDGVNRKKNTGFFILSK